MDMMRVWPIVVQYGVGAVFCAAAMVFSLRGGYLDLAYRDDRRTLWVLVGGFVLLLAVTCAFTFWLPYVPRDAMP